jgi:hypothetical protein
MGHARWIEKKKRQQQQQQQSLAGQRCKQDAVEKREDEDALGGRGALALTERDINPHHTHPLLELPPHTHSLRSSARSSHVAAQPGLAATTSRGAAYRSGGMEWKNHLLRLSSR